jgi:hypothetical protein
VVGTATSGSPRSRAIDLPRPIVEPLRQLARRPCDFDRHVRRRLGVDAGGGRAELSRGRVGNRALPWRREHERVPCAETLDLCCETIDCAGAEDHPDRRLVVVERSHRGGDDISA